MALSVIGAGVGRTGTHSLKLALNRLDHGPCHHMDEVLQHQAVQVPLWNGALNGKPDWAAIFHGYNSAVDWPTAGFFRELRSAYPDAKFILTTRTPETWAESFSETIYKVLHAVAQAPPAMKAWLEMGSGVINKTGFASELDVAGLIQAFKAHQDAVAATIPASKLLVFQVKDGWAPLCSFLGVPVPDEPFPRTNDRGEFWDRVSGKA